jgi:hypothetical protein
MALLTDENEPSGSAEPIVPANAGRAPRFQAEPLGPAWLASSFGHESGRWCMKPTRGTGAVLTAAVLSLCTLGCRTAAPGVATDAPQRYLTPEVGPFLEPHEIDGGIVSAVESVLRDHGFVRPWTATRASDESVWFTSDRLPSDRPLSTYSCYDQVFVGVTSEFQVRARIVGHAFISAWGIKGIKTVDPRAEEQAIAQQIQSGLPSEAH